MVVEHFFIYADAVNGYIVVNGRFFYNDLQDKDSY